MSINPHDDYEALAKLLYPSIEASGNVYYGQTRKLTIDELFDKNNNGFESYFCSCRKEDDSSQYEQHFYWKLGPFSDTVKIVDDADTYKDYPVAWLKYDLTKKETEHTNVLNAGEYSTYEVEYTLGHPSLYCSLDGLLPDGNIYNNSNFFLDENAKILYVLLYKAPVYEDMGKSLYIESLTDDITVRLVPANAEWPYEQLDQCVYKYGFDYTNMSNDLRLNEDIAVAKGSKIYFKCEDRPEFSSAMYLRFEINSDNPNAEVAVGGNIVSMAKFDEGDEILPFSYNGLFSDNDLITDATKLYISKLSNNSCAYLFNNCSRLKNAPAILPCFELKIQCCRYMFADCAELKNAPILPAKTGAVGCYTYMFSCTDTGSLSDIICLLNPHQDSYTVNWLLGRISVKIHVLPGSNWDPESVITVPEGCILSELESTIYTSIDDISVSNTPIEKYLITHGTNNENNGRGDITNTSTLANMEKSFDENNNHPVNTYNADGSFNQEIWGYKSFCSPVQFRNGIYTDSLTILSTYESGNTGPYVEYIETGSVIKHEKNDDLKIELINSKSHNTEDDIDFEDNTFLVPLHGCKNSEKDISCRAELRSISDYDFNNESCTFTSSVSSYTKGSIAQSRIEAIINADGRGTALATADIRVANDEPEVNLGVVDFRGGIVSSSLIISKSGSKFTGGVEVDGDITTDNIYVDGILHLGDAEISLDNDNLVISAPNGIAINTYTVMTDGLECGGESSFMGTVTADIGITSHGDITVDNGKKFKGNLEGVIPYVERDSFTEDGTVPVGCIVFLKIKDLSANKIMATRNPYEIGTEFTHDDNSIIDVCIGGFGESGMLEDTSDLVDRQTFRTLSRCEFSENGVAYALAIRVD